MSITRYLATLLGVAGLTSAAISGPAAAQAPIITAEMQQEAERLCEEILKDPTIEQIERFLEDYWWAKTACNVLAQTLSQDQPGGRDGPSPDNPGGGGYGG